LAEKRSAEQSKSENLDTRKWRLKKLKTLTKITGQSRAEQSRAEQNTQKPENENTNYHTNNKQKVNHSIAEQSRAETTETRKWRLRNSK
jgi:hypothetical protein